MVNIDILCLSIWVLLVVDWPTHLAAQMCPVTDKMAATLCFSSLVLVKGQGCCFFTQRKVWWQWTEQHHWIICWNEIWIWKNKSKNKPTCVHTKLSAQIFNQSLRSITSNLCYLSVICCFLRMLCLLCIQQNKCLCVYCNLAIARDSDLDFFYVETVTTHSVNMSSHKEAK